MQDRAKQAKEGSEPLSYLALAKNELSKTVSGYRKQVRACESKPGPTKQAACKFRRQIFDARWRLIGPNGVFNLITRWKNMEALEETL